MPYWFDYHEVAAEVGGHEITIETGRLAKQAHGAALVTIGDTAVLVTATHSRPRPGIDFFPLTVDYVEKFSAAGKIPGGFFKREGRLAEREILVSRFIDRSIRPLFPEGYRDETQITATVLSADGIHPPDIAGFVGASAALTVSEIPFVGPIGAVRVARVDGKLVANPTRQEIEDADLELVVAGNRSALVMVEGEAREVPEAQLLEALKFAHDSLVPLLEVQDQLRSLAGRPKIEVTPPARDPEVERRVRERAEPRMREAVRVAAKKARYDTLAEIEREVLDELTAELLDQPASFGSLRAVRERESELQRRTTDAREALHELRSGLMRSMILEEGRRIDGRAHDEIRPIACEVGVAPRAHGTAVFTRGETQALVYTTLGSAQDSQTIDALTERSEKVFMLHYNFPPFSVGEARMLRGPSRREIGHGNLAERALKAVLPDYESFPYTIRVVSEVLESNGSSSMATVCGATLALMDAGVPLRGAVAGIAMGLVQEGDRVAILSDILGDEDHLGDMDFKVAGTRDGITAVQMDIKIPEVNWSVMEKALAQARQGRLHILEKMAEETREELPDLTPRPQLGRFAPRMDVIYVKPDRIRDIIGPGGRIIRGIQDTTGAKVDVEDSGRVTIFSPDLDALERAKAMVKELTQEAELGRLYCAKVKRITDFGAFAEIFPGTDGLVHISHLAEGRVDKVTDVVQEGDEILVKCIDIDPSGRVRLSRKEALAELPEEGGEEAPAGE